MRLTLRTKILGAFALIVLVSLGTAVGTGSRLTRSRYDDFADMRDLARARALSAALGEWTVIATETPQDKRLPLPIIGVMPGTPDSIDRFPERSEHRQPEPHVPESLRPPRQTNMMDGMMDGMQRMMAPGYGFDYLDRLVITDTLGNVLADSAGYGAKTLNPAQNDGMPIRLENRNVGYLYLGSMIPGISTRSRDNSFFRVAGYATWVVTAVIFLFAMLLGILLTAHIVGPVKTLNSAAKAVENGNFQYRVPEERRDELGDLSRGFNSMAGALESADLQRRRLIADSAHELRTPVSLIRARIEMMEEGIYPMDRDGLAALSAEAGRLNSLVEELRTLANLESPASTLKKQELNIAELLGSVFEAAKPALDQRGINVSLNLSDGNQLIIGDTEKLYQVLVNLLTNAQRYAEGRIVLSGSRVYPTSGAAINTPHRLPGDVPAYRNKPVFQDGRTLFHISVEDDGPGIPAADRTRVFERFYRVDASRSRSTGGSGLGLAICREIILAHGGNIYADSSESLGGAAIRIDLPVG